MKSKYLHLQDVEYFRSINCKKTNPLSLLERLVYSLLAFRSRVGEGENLNYFRNYLGTKSAKPALDNLVQHGLVEVDGNIYRAVPPSEKHVGWFTVKKGKPKLDHWSDQYMTYKWYRVTDDCELSLAQQAVYYLALDFDRQMDADGCGYDTVNQKSFATILALSVRTVQRATDFLESHELCTFRKSTTRGKMHIHPKTINPSRDVWWKKRKDATPEPNWLTTARRVNTKARHLSELLHAVNRFRAVYPCKGEGCVCPYGTGWLEPVDAVLVGEFQKAVNTWVSEGTHKTPVPLFVWRVRKLVEFWRQFDNQPYMEYGLSANYIPPIEDAVLYRTYEEPHENDVLFER